MHNLSRKVNTRRDMYNIYIYICVLTYIYIYIYSVVVGHYQTTRDFEVAQPLDIPCCVEDGLVEPSWMLGLSLGWALVEA